ncbi:hypothetical protein AMELA_G00119220 [Ameiurus melas]|uniref:Uncharacterized protein n=1 Tax=Ameiurus melas TaxID=219545 RepID=A0A7J6AL97_AMEME|nr:hypothetical protein AMELA_G00119220 [Ameiurus melas]
MRLLLACEQKATLLRRFTSGISPLHLPHIHPFPISKFRKSYRTGLKSGLHAGKWTPMPHAREAVSFREQSAVTREELVTDKAAKRAVLVHVLKSAVPGLRVKM